MVDVGDDDDWFERALRDDGDEPETPGDEEDAESAESADERARNDADSARADSDPFGGVRDGPTEPTAREATERRPSADRGVDDGGDAEDGTAGGSSDATDDAGYDWSDFGSALENAPEPGGDGVSGGPNQFEGNDGGFGFDDGFGTESGEFGMKSGEFGAAGPPQSGPEEFDEENFESEIARLDIGVDGLDEMILGGVPTRSLMVAIGSAGTGKTTFGLQFLNRALERGGSAVFITLEESRERIVDTAEEKGWSFREYESEGRLAIVDLDPVEMANSLESIQSDLPRLVEEFDADRLVLDSVSLLEMMYDRPSKRRTRVFEFARSLKEAGVTTMLTSEASGDNPYVSRHGIVEYLADAVFVLQYVRPNDFRETRLAIEIQKIRDANHSRETKPYELTDEGISVYGRANIF